MAVRGRNSSPLGQLPAIEDGSVRMIECNAIMQYLLAKYGPPDLAVTPDERDFPSYLQFLEFGESGLCAIGNAYVATCFRAPENQRKNWTFDYVVSAMRARMKIVEKHLETREFIAADRFTAADISVGWGLGIIKFFGIGETLSPTLEGYRQRMIARPASIKASAEPAAAA